MNVQATETFKEWLEEFEAAPFRAFETMAEYRRWCETHVPAWLGYGRV